MTRFMGLARHVATAFVAFSAGALVTFVYGRFSQENFLMFLQRSEALEKVKIKQVKPPSLENIDGITKYGIPGDENLLLREGYIVSYSNRLRQPNWVLEMLNSEQQSSSEAQNGIDRVKCIFMADPEIHPFFRAKSEDFKSTGYQRGHLAAASNHKLSQENVCTTFLLSNISPQIGKGFNQSVWVHLERHARLLVERYKQVYIVTGPLFLSIQRPDDGSSYVTYEVIGKSGVAVPTHFFKVILGVTNEDTYEIQSYVIPNIAVPNDAKYGDYLCPLQNIERAAGLIFFDKIPREKLTEWKTSHFQSNVMPRRGRRRKKHIVNPSP